MIAGIVGGKQLISVAGLSKARALTNSSPVAGTEDLAMWLESTSKKSFDSAQPSDGGAIATWKDINPQTNNKVNATQTTPAFRPIYRLDGINGLPATTYTSISSLVYDAPIPNNSKYTVFIVAQLPNSSSSINIIRASSTDPTSGFTLSYGSNFISWRHGLIQSNHIINTSISAFSSPTNTIHSVVNNGSNDGFLYINGEEIANVSSAPLITNAANQAQILSGNNEEMKVGEIIIFTKALNSFERKEIEKYLSKKWKIELVN